MTIDVSDSQLPSTATTRAFTCKRTGLHAPTCTYTHWLARSVPCRVLCACQKRTFMPSEMPCRSPHVPFAFVEPFVE